MPLHNLVGTRYGRLEVISRAPNRKRQTVWFCKCDCGAIKPVQATSLYLGRTKSSGCYNRETSSKHRTHGCSVGGARTREYQAWQNMKARCNQPNNPAYADYGGRGIVVCPEWLHDAAAFLRDMGPCPQDYTIERKDVNGPYAPGNC